MPIGKQVLAVKNQSKILGTAKVGEKGQVVIPKDARKYFDINPGDELLFIANSKTGLVITKTEVLNDVIEQILAKTSQKE